MLPEEETVALARDIRKGRTRRCRDRGTSPMPAETTSRPSIAVLPLTTLSGEADYFADGIAEEIATALSRNRGLVLIARGSSFALRNRGMDTQEIGAALGARYLVGGSAARMGDQVRLNVTLTDASTGVEIWSEAYSEFVGDIFALQDRIASLVVGTLLPKMEQTEIARAVRKPTDDLDAYDLYLRGLAEMHGWTAEASERAIALFARAIERDPTFAGAYAMMIRCYSQRKASGWVRDREAETAETQRLALVVVDLAPDDALCLAMAGIGYGFVVGQPEKGVRLTERALQLNPNLAVGWLFSSWIHVWLGLPETAIEHATRAMRLSPQDPQFAMMQTATACAHFFAGRESDAVDLAERAVLVQPNYWIAWCILAAARSATGDTTGAVDAMSRVTEIDRSLRSTTLAQFFPIRGEENVSRWSAALIEAGLPD
jgi:TolB-like protein